MEEDSLTVSRFNCGESQTSQFGREEGKSPPLSTSHEEEEEETAMQGCRTRKSGKLILVRIKVWATCHELFEVEREVGERGKEGGKYGADLTANFGFAD